MKRYSRRNFLATAGAAMLGSICGTGITKAAGPLIRSLPAALSGDRLRLKTLDGSRIPVDKAAFNALLRQLRGELITADNPFFDNYRSIWNAGIDRKPGVIVRCQETADIAAALRFARAHDALLSVRAGGHNHAGFAVCEGGVMLDLRPMKNLHVDSEKRIADAQPGLTFAEYDTVTQRSGLASTGAIVSMVGLPGYTLGGGIGWLHRKTGLGCDNLLAAEVVTANGEILRASPQENSDLFWAIRGGGGNFGIVSRLHFRLHPVKQVMAGLIFHPLEDFPKIAKFIQDYGREAPDELCVWLMTRKAPPSPLLPKKMHGRPVVIVAVCYAGPESAGEKIVKPLRQFGKPLKDLIKERTYGEWQKALDGAWGDGFHNEWMGHYLQSLSPDAVETMLHHVDKISSPFSDVKLAHMGGAVSRVGELDTAFGSRNAEYALVIQTRWKEAAASDYHLQWTKEFHQAMRPFSTGKVYVNFVANEGAGRVKDAYNDSAFQRLQSIKAKYDPANFFRMNQNILPEKAR